MTRLGLNGYGVRPAGDFSGREIPHPVGIITRLSLNGYGIRRIGNFTGKPESEVVEAGSTGGNYKKTYRPLGSLEKYEERIRKALEEERQEILAERDELRTRLITIEQEKGLESKKISQKAANERELQILLLKETILRIETELDLLQKQAMEIGRLAEILRDDDEIMMLIAAGVADGSI